MSIRSNARNYFGLLIRNHREKQHGLNRAKLAEQAGVKREVIVRLEHGVKNPTRQELVRVINTLPISKNDKRELFSYLRLFSPRKNKRNKKHY